MAQVEINMAEAGTTQSLDTKDAITEAESILAGNQHVSTTLNASAVDSGARRAQVAGITPHQEGPPPREGGRGGEGPPGGPEGPRGPELPRGPEWEISPERGMMLCDEITRLRTKFFYTERYQMKLGDSLLPSDYLSSHPEIYSEAGLYLSQLYKDFQEYVDAVCRQRNARDPWDRFVRDIEGNLVTDAEGHIQTKVFAESPLLLTKGEDGVYHLEKPSRDTGRETRPPEPIDFTSLPSSSLEELAIRFNNLSNATPEEAKIVLEELSRYFEQAHSYGLLKGVDTVLRSIRDDVLSGEDEAQVTELMERKLERARRLAQEKFRRLSRGRPEFNRLNRIWEFYITLAEERFLDLLEGEPQREYEPGEFHLDQQAEEERETYWEIGNYPKYYLVTAKTPEQFLIAKESFLRMIRSGTLAKSGQALYEHVNNFKEMFGTQGSRQVKRGTVTEEFIRDQRIELEGQLLVFVINYANESYTPKLSKDASTTMALDEGPERWYRLLRAGDGQVAAFTDRFDQVGQGALMEIYNNPVGDRGELDIIAQHCLQDLIQQKVIEWGMGVALKAYDPRDEDPNSDSPSEDRVARIAALERIQTEIRGGRRASDLSNSEQEIYGAYQSNLERLGLHQPGENFRSLYEGFDNGDAHILDFLRYGQLSDNQSQQLPDYLKEFVNRNRVQLTEDQLKELPQGLRGSIELGRVQLEILSIRREIQSGQKRVDSKHKTAVDFLSRDDKKVYQNAFDKAQANFDIAFEMQGASGEKARRGRGFFYVERNPYIQAYNEVEKRSRKIEWLLGEFQKGKKLEEFSEEIQEYYRGLTDQEKQQFLPGLYGVDPRKLPLEQRESILNSIRIGWMLSGMKDGSRLNSFSQEEQYLYYDLGRFDQNGKFKFKDQATESQVRAGTIKWITPADREIYIDHIPTYLAEKFVQYVVTRTKIQHANSKAKDRTVAVAQARKDAIEQLKKLGWQAELRLPRILFNEARDVVGIDENTTETISFQEAIKHIYSRYTTHTYWGYQGENTDMILRPELLEAAKRIRAGSRPEDEDVLATQLLIIDPTLKRVKDFDPATDIAARQREITLFQAAVEESFLSHVYINKDLFKEFLPEDGHKGKMRSGYNMEDWGGMMRFTMGIKELSASQPARFTRRLGAEIAIMPIYVDSMAAMWGQDGVLGAVSMFADKIKDTGHQKIVSQFGITKFIDQMDYAVQLYNALIGSVQEGLHVEGLYMKPTNDNEILHKFIAVMLNNSFDDSPADQLEFLQKFRETRARLEKVLKIMRVMYSDVRNSGGALRLENVDIFLDNGKFNPAIEGVEEIYMNTGTSRHLISDFYDDFTDWVVSEWPGGGGQIYPEELIWNNLYKRRLAVFNGKGRKIGTRTFKRWLFEKAGL